MFRYDITRLLPTDLKVLGIIPARGGSKGVPGKNLLKLDGKPLISYTIEAALESRWLHRICVSSDDHKILEVGLSYSIDTHMRPNYLAGDQSPVTDTIRDIITNVEYGQNYDSIMLLQPTAPIREGRDIDGAVELLINSNNINSVVSVCPMNEVHPARMYWMKNDCLEPILQVYEQKRRQDIPVAYYRNGSIYLVRTKSFIMENSVMAKPMAPYCMLSSRLLNIDEPHDIKLAEYLLPLWKQGKL